MAVILNESKPAIVTDLENAFGDWLWTEGDNFSPNKLHLKTMFNIVNKHIFGGELDSNIPKDVIREGVNPKLDHAMAAFAFGSVKGQKTQIIMIKHRKKDNFFITLCSLIHEMIHMYDFNFGKMKKMMDKYGAVALLNWNIPHPFVNVRNIMASGLRPDQIPDEVTKPMRDMAHGRRIHWAEVMPKQYQFPGKKTTIRNPKTGELMDIGRPIPGMKYKMDDLDGFYDVHGAYFQQFADMANRMGFDVTAVFDPKAEHKMRVVDEDRDEDPLDDRYVLNDEPIRSIYDFLDAPEKQIEFKDPENWFIAIR